MTNPPYRTNDQNDRDNQEPGQRTPARRRPRKAKSQAKPQANYERSPRLWEDTVWEPENTVQEATLILPVEGYLTWLASHRMERAVGMQPSAYENPLSTYVGLVLGMQPRLQTDGHRAWCMLQLTKTTSGTDARYLRVVLPPWTTPLALEYTAFLIGRTSGYPQQKAVSAYEARTHLRTLPPV